LTLETSEWIITQKWHRNEKDHSRSSRS
jgi:hypothetical protein